METTIEKVRRNFAKNENPNKTCDHILIPEYVGDKRRESNGEVKMRLSRFHFYLNIRVSRQEVRNKIYRTSPIVIYLDNLASKKNRNKKGVCPPYNSIDALVTRYITTYDQQKKSSRSNSFTAYTLKE